MKVLNVHSRRINTSVQDLRKLFATLATKEDKIWPDETWPPMRFKNGLKIGSNGGHGPIRYQIVGFKPESHIEFKFQKPNGFNGIHRLEIFELDAKSSEIKHSIDIQTTGLGTIKWLVAIRWLHDALIEDAFDKVQNQLTQSKLKTEWSAWVKMWYWLLKPKRKL